MKFSDIRNRIVRYLSVDARRIAVLYKSELFGYATIRMIRVDQLVGG
jgi:hypothetical protein